MNRHHTTDKFGLKLKGYNYYTTGIVLAPVIGRPFCTVYFAYATITFEWPTTRSNVTDYCGHCYANFAL